MSGPSEVLRLKGRLATCQQHRADLLAALKEWVLLDESHFMVTGLLERSRAAIAKAEGK